MKGIHFKIKSIMDSFRRVKDITKEEIDEEIILIEKAVERILETKEEKGEKGTKNDSKVELIKKQNQEFL